MPDTGEDVAEASEHWSVNSSAPDVFAVGLCLALDIGGHGGVLEIDPQAVQQAISKTALKAEATACMGPCLEAPRSLQTLPDG